MVYNTIQIIDDIESIENVLGFLSRDKKSGCINVRQKVTEVSPVFLNRHVDRQWFIRVPNVPTYIERAEVIENELNLPAACEEVDDLGIRDTFPFEERTFLQRALEALRDDDLDGVRDIVGRHAQSVWLGKGESQAQWALVVAAQELIETCQDLDRDLPKHVQSQDALVSFYIARFREADRLQREFEQAVASYLHVETPLNAVVDQARDRYRLLVGKVQSAFTKHFETAGWPPEGRLVNANVYDTFVAPALAEHGRRAIRP